jgi:RNA ligase
MYADDVFGKGFLRELSEEVALKHVRTQVHPTGDLTIYNYSEQTVWDRHWNRVTLNTRGLILDSAGNIVARPFPKFFNYGEPDAPEFSIHDRVEVTDKIDGSLGIIYRDPFTNLPTVATRGSFASEQAVFATDFLDRHPEYMEWFADVEDTEFTALVEIVYPENRIVCDYGNEEDLVLLGVVDRWTGESVGPKGPRAYPGRRAETFEYKTFSDALAAPTREGAEGFVVRKAGTEQRIKLKQEDYVLLHRVVTNLNERAVWEVLKDPSQDTWAWIAQLPDEFHDWAKKVADDLRMEFRKIEDTIREEYEAIKMVVEIQNPNGWGRKEFAGYAVTTPYAWAHFALLDDNFYGGKRAVEKIWEIVKPEANKKPHGRTAEDDE